MDPLRPSPPQPFAQRLVASLPGLTHYVRGRLGPDLASKESVSDIVQSTCGEILRRPTDFLDLGEAGFRAWVCRAAERKIQSRSRYWHAQRRDGTLEPLEGGPPDEPREPAAPTEEQPDRYAAVREEVERLAHALQGLSTEYRLVLQRSQFEGVSYRELGAELDRSPEAARKLVARALARLAERRSSRS
jgi:RNA polymerase sigma factor (sigma-70 family)